MRSVLFLVPNKYILDPHSAGNRLKNAFNLEFLEYEFCIAMHK